ncbi:ABC-type branched-subunit amino acid transport system substrate-binding protein/predicted negative regulator of RcsB-dependent stress response [Dyadobacter sp. BE34]|uniref:ABC-type branched-subunit amino acid transport system substrate-binding protein/predicted negative regulator of RcsB-dependent stress response n=1 Tax=Dyadobacter fermentans TaxID=94254 RepID=A0ABU1QXI0_9BACT|nr:MULTISPECIES: ABC transporter substrate-binding protein [Dyadobacter]MDR6805712.1 ABC-type branched-subunit amino acid transport system substrate-binding protein/predicted negative regulator of RcsB-dependent stress response [Dyadobacter fermentans]MDR7042528.1 ABC-type branched-subunit amino acid transport system substrate-binding protein/predicted negative regulator of RcsB-dependent stress response [Dyadobacter sp. BE242]MDR7196840.1 ABC-type branched-subunit amino acid transport system su
MRVIFFLILTVSIGLYQPSFGQSNAQAESRYRSALADYKQGKYAMAMEKFYPMTSVNAKTAYSPYAHYYYALSAYQLKRYKDAKPMLLQLQSRYPGWNKINDVYYLLGAVSLANGQINDGLDQLARIKESSLNKDVQALKQHHLGAIRDFLKLKDLQKQYPSDRDIALMVYQSIQAARTPAQGDLAYAEQLDKQFKFRKNEKVEEAPKRSTPKSDTQWTKGYLDVAVLLPFRLDEFHTSKRRSNQFAYDYYLGLTVAKEQLQTEGITVNLWAYDVSNDAKSMQAIADNKNFQLSDMIIGPLYPGTFDVAADFVSGSNAIMLNPLSTDGALLKSGNIYLGHPSISYQTQKAAQWMRTLSPGLNTVIYYGNTAKDSVMAASYATEWKAKGGKVMSITRIQPDRESLESKVPSFETNKPAHIALFSSDGESGGNLIEVLNGRKLNTLPVLATSTSFNTQQSRLSRYGTRLTLLDADYVDREKETIRIFQKNYYAKTSTFPSVYSYQGYDQLLFFARMLSKYRDKLPAGLQSRKFGSEEYLLSGFDYTKANENQITPVLKYSGSKWVPVDR